MSLSISRLFYLQESTESLQRDILTSHHPVGHHSCFYFAVPAHFPFFTKPPVSCILRLLFPSKPRPFTPFSWEVSNPPLLKRLWGKALPSTTPVTLRKAVGYLSSWILMLDKSCKPSAPLFVIYSTGINKTTRLMPNTQGGNLANVGHKRRKNTLCFTIQLILRIEPVPAAEDLAFHVKTEKLREEMNRGDSNGSWSF